MRALALCMLGLNPIFWASFYIVSKGALGAVDPLAFATLEMSMAALPAGVLLFLFRHQITRGAVRSGLRLGAVLFCAVLVTTIALYFTSATNTAFFPALNGMIAAVIARVFLRQRLAGRTILACVISAIGALLVIFGSAQGGGNPVGDLIAFAAAILYTLYIFAVDRETPAAVGGQLWVITGVELLFMAALGWVALLAWGDAGQVFTAAPSVLVAGLYVGVFTTFLPSVIALGFQRHVPPMTVALLYVPEPVWAALGAHIFHGEAVPMLGFLGGALIVLGALVNILGSGRRQKTSAQKAEA